MSETQPQEQQQPQPTLAACGAILCASERPLSMAELAGICDCEIGELEPLIEKLKKRLEALGMELVRVAGGLRVQTGAEHAGRVGELFKEASGRFTRATLETLALIAYRQPITRGEIEHIRSVSVSGNIIRSLAERGWIRIIGHRDVPGKPALYGTTGVFLDYFNLKSLAQLPALPDIKSIEDIDKAIGELLPAQQQDESATHTGEEERDSPANE